jgi:hypothetical protein
VIILDIPQQTLTDEMERLEGLPTQEAHAGYLLGALTALEWVMDRKMSPSDFLAGGVSGR